MDDTSTYEYVVSAKRRPAYRWRRALAVCGYVLYVLTFLLIGAVTKLLTPLLALIPLTTWMLVAMYPSSLMTMPVPTPLPRRYASVEFEYSLTGGVMTLSKIYGGRTRKCVAQIKIKEMTAIMPFEGDHISAAGRYAPERTVDFTADLQHPNVYCTKRRINAEVSSILRRRTRHSKSCDITILRP